ncbi:MAG: hypothetical protein K0Q72_1608 [Armatimonadetes bacterium]|nr:hypothetical protein [Armatimonadota bacterium]
MKRTITGLLGALFLSGTLLGSLAAPSAAEAAPRRRVVSRSYDRDRDGIPDWRDRSVFGRRHFGTRRRDIDGDGIRNRRDRDRDGDGIRNRRDRDRDGDGVRNKRDRHPSRPRRR